MKPPSAGNDVGKQLAAAFLGKLSQRKKLKAPKETFYEFMARVSPHLAEPRHLDPIVSLLARTRREKIRAVTATPPRHGKTTTILHAIVWLIEQDPTFTVAYCSYAAGLAEEKNRDCINIARASIESWEALGYEPPFRLAEDRQGIVVWRTTKGGGVVARGIGGGLTGLGFRLVVVDDPVKDRQDADSALIRNRTWQWFTSVAFTREDPRGTSFIVNATRWHPDDLSGRLIARGWQYVNLKALDDERGALWPEGFPEAALLEKKASDAREWASLYQGEPRALGDNVFNDYVTYSKLPDGSYKTSVGLDFAYTAKTYSDYNVAVVLRIYPNAKPRVYVVDVLRKRCSSPEFKTALRQFLRKHGTSTRFPPCRAYIAGTETAIIDFYGRKEHDEEGKEIPGIPIKKMPAKGDKLSRAQDVAAAWNKSDIAVPEDAPWLEEFIAEVNSFTGIEDPHDDQVDALAGAFVPAVVTPPFRGNGYGRVLAFG